MVDALKQIHRLLRPGGRLVDIHPTDDTHDILVRLGSSEHLAGWLREANDYLDYRQATDALHQAVRLGYFKLTRQREFFYEYCADSVDSLKEYLAENWKGSTVDDRVAASVEELMRSLEPNQMCVLRVPVFIARLKALPLPAAESS